MLIGREARAFLFRHVASRMLSTFLDPSPTTHWSLRGYKGALSGCQLRTLFGVSASYRTCSGVMGRTGSVILPCPLGCIISSTALGSLFNRQHRESHNCEHLLGVSTPNAGRLMICVSVRPRPVQWPPCSCVSLTNLRLNFPPYPETLGLSNCDYGN